MDTKRLVTAFQSLPLLQRIQKEFDLFRLKEISILTIGSFIIMLFELMGVSALMPLSSLIVAPEATASQPVYVALKEAFGIESTKELVALVGGVIAGIFILKGFLNIIYWRYEFSILTRWRIQITNRLYRLYLSSDYLYFLRTSPARIVNAITDSVPVITNNFIHQFIALFNNILMGVLLLGFMFTVNLMICVILLTTAILLVAAHKFFQGETTKKLGQTINRLTIAQSRLLNNSIAGYKETRIHNKEERFADDYMQVATDLADKDLDFLFVKNLPTITVEMAVMFVVVMIFVSMMYFEVDSAQIAAHIGILTILSFRMIPIINRVIASTTLINSSQTPLRNIFADMDKARVKEAPLAHEKTTVPDLSSRLDVDLEIKDFAYPDSQSPVLHNIALHVKKGEFVGLTGPSGSGKSTLIHILLGFITHFSGRYTINDTEICAGNVASLRDVLGYVDQSIFVMDGSIAGNVAFGEKDHEIDRKRVREALEKAQLWDFVSGLENGIDHTVGERGNLLSGGQKQRLAIARCFYRDVSFLILDEASASLDVETERDFFDYLATLKGQITVIMIAHRLSTLKSCDRILFMQNGRIAASGDFPTLYKTNETFKKYVDYSNIDIQG